jgi:hypothetical protein
MDNVSAHYSIVFQIYNLKGNCDQQMFLHKNEHKHCWAEHYMPESVFFSKDETFVRQGK